MTLPRIRIRTMFLLVTLTGMLFAIVRDQIEISQLRIRVGSLQRRVKNYEYIRDIQNEAAWDLTEENAGVKQQLQDRSD